ncbi:MAG: GNAT family N-acetyltransferase [Allosphingosinicella sp.]
MPTQSILDPEDGRCRLRPAEAEDAEAYVDYLRRNWPRFRGAMPTEDETTFDAATHARRFAAWTAAADEPASVAILLVDRDTPRILGNITFANIVYGALRACHLGYKIDREIEGLGIMRRSIETCFETMFGRYRLHRIMANYRPENVRSGALLKGLGFEVEGFARDYLHLDGQWRDHILTALVRPSPR